MPPRPRDPSQDIRPQTPPLGTSETVSNIATLLPIPQRRVTEDLIGTLVDAQDRKDKWYVAQIIDIDISSQHVLCHFIHWSSQFDEWIALNSTKIQMFGTNTCKK